MNNSRKKFCKKSFYKVCLFFLFICRRLTVWCPRSPLQRPHTSSTWPSGRPPSAPFPSPCPPSPHSPSTVPWFCQHCPGSTSLTRCCQGSHKGPSYPLTSCWPPCPPCPMLECSCRSVTHKEIILWLIYFCNSLFYSSLLQWLIYFYVNLS